MITLTSTTQKLQLVLAGAVSANQLNVVACYADRTSTAYAGGVTPINSNNTTAVDIVPAPAASTIREVDLINVYNADTATATVTVRYNDNATLYPFLKVALLTGETLNYTHAAGWVAIDVNGNRKEVTASVFSSIKDTGLTSGRVTYATTNGLLTDSANLTFDGTTLTANTLTVSTGALTVNSTGISAFGAPSAGAIVENRTINISNTANAGAKYRVISGGASASGNPTFEWLINGVQAWTSGIASADSNKWVLSIGGDLSAPVISATTAGDIQWGKALVAMGGGAAPTFGTIGGSGPGTAGQNAWMRVLDSTGAAFWVPAWK